MRTCFRTSAEVRPFNNFGGLLPQIGYTARSVRSLDKVGVEPGVSCPAKPGQGFCGVLAKAMACRSGTLSLDHVTASPGLARTGKYAARRARDLGKCYGRRQSSNFEP